MQPLDQVEARSHVASEWVKFWFCEWYCKIVHRKAFSSILKWSGSWWKLLLQYTPVKQNYEETQKLVPLN